MQRIICDTNGNFQLFSNQEIYVFHFFFLNIYV